MDKINEEKITLQDSSSHESSAGYTSNHATVYGIKITHRLRKLLVVFGISGIWFMVLGSFWHQQQNTISVLNLRKRWIDTGFEDLKGDFDLLDLLAIKSESGSIDARIVPQKVDDENPKPAELLIHTSSGSVNLYSAVLYPPERDYRTHITTFSGIVKGSILHGERTKISTYSGSINAHFVLYGTGNYSSTLSTSTSSGSHDITVLPSTADKGLPLTEMKSVHSSESGTLVLRYDQQWEGVIEGHSEMGRLKLHGEDIEIIRQGSYPPSGEYVLAKKGNGNSTLVFHTSSGWIDVYFGQN